MLRGCENLIFKSKPLRRSAGTGRPALMRQARTGRAKQKSLWWFHRLFRPILFPSTLHPKVRKVIEHAGRPRMSLPLHLQTRQQTTLFLWGCVLCGRRITAKIHAISNAFNEVGRIQKFG